MSLICQENNIGSYDHSIILSDQIDTREGIKT